MSETEQTLTFEKALERLEATVARLEGGELSLEESLALFEEGQGLVTFCNEQLEAAALTVEQLTAEGEIRPVDVA